MDIGVPSGDSLTADQWLLLATVYSPVAVHISTFYAYVFHPSNSFDTSQIPQLWELSLQMYGGSEASNRCISKIIEIEAERELVALQKADDKKALADVKSQGKEAMATLRARIAQDNATAL
jgi:hypothetical protein